MWSSRPRRHALYGFEQPRAIGRSLRDAVLAYHMRPSYSLLAGAAADEIQDGSTFVVFNGESIIFESFDADC